MIGIIPFYSNRTTFIKIPIRKLGFFEPHVNLTSLTTLSQYSSQCLEKLLLNNSTTLPQFHILKFTIKETQIMELTRFLKIVQDRGFQVRFTEKKVLCLVTDSNEHYWKNVLSSHRRKDFRRIKKRLYKNYNVNIDSPNPNEINKNFYIYWNRFLKIYQNSWKASSHRSVSKITAQERFYRELFEKYDSHHQLYVSFLQLNNHDVASSWWVKYESVVYGIQTAFLYDFKKYSPGTFLIQSDIFKFIEYGENNFDFMGSQKYKEYFTNYQKTYYDIYIFNNTNYGRFLSRLTPFSSIDLKPLAGPDW